MKQSRKVMGWKSRLMSLYLKSEEDTMKNEIFLRHYIAPHTHVWGYIYLFTKCIEEFYKLLNYFSHYTES